MSVTLITLLLANSFFFVYGLKENPSILVIGAGPSGIAAASKLWRNNLTNIRILEAEDRIGGRVRSVKFGDAYVDLGGEWCHGEQNNIVYNIIKQYNVLRHTNVTVQVYYSNGTLLDPKVYHNLVEFSESIDASLDNPKIEQKCRNFSSIGQCFDSEFDSTITELYQNNSDLRTITIEAREWLQSYMLSFDSPSSLYDLSRKSTYKRCEGDLLLNWDGRGYKTILEVMLQQFPDSTQGLPVAKNIMLNKEVTRIVWDGNNQVQVLCFDNTTYAVDHVIFTPSLGVLKANHKSLFEPALSEDKVRAIKNVGYGAIMKIILHFPHTWWNTTDAYTFIWSTEDREKIISEFGRGPLKDGRSWLTTHVGSFTAERNPKVLISFFAGEMIPEMEQESKEVLTAGLMYMFRKFLGRIYDNITSPDDIIKSTWYSNPHFRGTYSYDLASNTEQGLQNRLAAPLEREGGHPAVMFAGEATHPYYFSTVHGAIETGYREAGRLIDYYSNKLN